MPAAARRHGCKRTPANDVQLATIRSIIAASIAAGRLLRTARDDGHTSLESEAIGTRWSVLAGGDLAHGEDNKGLCDVRADMTEAFRWLLHSWLRPHRGIWQEKPLA